MATYFNDLFNGTGNVTSHTPDTGFSSGPWQGTPGTLTLSGGVAINPGTVTFDVWDDAYYGHANTPDFGNPTSYQVNFVFKTGPNVSPYVDGHAGMVLNIITGGDYSVGDAIQLMISLDAEPAGGWRVVLYDGTSDDIESVTVSPNTEYPGKLVVTPGSQVLTLAGKTLTGSGTPVGIYGLNEIGISLGYGGHGITELSITDIVSTTTGSITSTLPTLTSTMRGGGTAAGSLQPVSSLMRGGGTLLGATLPGLEGRLIGGSRALHTLDVDLPSIQGAMRAGNNLRGSMPSMQVAMSGTTTILMTVDVDLPRIEVSMAGTTGGTGVLRATLPVMQGAMRAGGSIGGDLPGLSGQMAGITGGVGRINAALPMLTAEMNATLGVFGIIRAALPMLVPSPYGRIVSMLPMMQATLTGRTVVAVTYEAYAVNLKPGPKMPNQVTRYTNYPFNQIVRFKDRYLGVADDGLYELGGDTDYATPTPAKIAWSWKTGITDFGSSQMKVDRQLVIGGRLGANVVASVSAGEKADVTYTYTPERGRDAQNYRVKLGKGFKARYYSFGLSGTGADGDIDTIDFDAQNHSRKI
jgi:hypothetical protein